MGALNADTMRTKAIETMLEMAKDAANAKMDDMAAGYYDEAARLVDADAELASTEEEGAARRATAADYRNKAKRHREEKLGPPPAGPGTGGGFEVTWTQGPAEGEHAVGPDGNGWEPFAMAFKPDGSAAFAWRRARP